MIPHLLIAIIVMSSKLYDKNYVVFAERWSRQISSETYYNTPDNDWVPLSRPCTTCQRPINEHNKSKVNDKTLLPQQNQFLMPSIFQLQSLKLPTIASDEIMRQRSYEYVTPSQHINLNSGQQSSYEKLPNTYSEPRNNQAALVNKILPENINNNFHFEPKFRHRETVPILSTVPEIHGISTEHGNEYVFNIPSNGALPRPEKFINQYSNNPMYFKNTHNNEPQEVQLLYVPFNSLWENKQQDIQHNIQSQEKMGHAFQLQPQSTIITDKYNAFQFFPSAYQINTLYTDPPILSLNAQKVKTKIKHPSQYLAVPHKMNRKPKTNQPPLAIFMRNIRFYGQTINTKEITINDIITTIIKAKSIDVIDTVNNRLPKIFIGPSGLLIPNDYRKFDLPYLSSIEDHTENKSELRKLPIFVAPLSYQTTDDYTKIVLPAPHIGAIIVKSNPNMTEKSRDQNSALIKAYQETRIHKPMLESNEAGFQTTRSVFPVTNSPLKKSSDNSYSRVSLEYDFHNINDYPTISTTTPIEKHKDKTKNSETIDDIMEKSPEAQSFVFTTDLNVDSENNYNSRLQSTATKNSHPDLAHIDNITTTITPLIASDNYTIGKSTSIFTSNDLIGSSKLNIDRENNRNMHNVPPTITTPFYRPMVHHTFMDDSKFKPEHQTNSILASNLSNKSEDYPLEDLSEANKMNSYYREPEGQELNPFFIESNKYDHYTGSKVNNLRLPVRHNKHGKIQLFNDYKSLSNKEEQVIQNDYTNSRLTHSISSQINNTRQNKSHPHENGQHTFNYVTPLNTVNTNFNLPRQINFFLTDYSTTTELGPPTIEISTAYPKTTLSSTPKRKLTTTSVGLKINSRPTASKNRHYSLETRNPYGIRFNSTVKDTQYVRPSRGRGNQQRKSVHKVKENNENRIIEEVKNYPTSIVTSSYISSNISTHNLHDITDIPFTYQRTNSIPNLAVTSTESNYENYEMERNQQIILSPINSETSENRNHSENTSFIENKASTAHDSIIKGNSLLETTIRSTIEGSNSKKVEENTMDSLTDIPPNIHDNHVGRRRNKVITTSKPVAHRQRTRNNVRRQPIIYHKTSTNIPSDSDENSEINRNSNFQHIMQFNKEFYNTKPTSAYRNLTRYSNSRIISSDKRRRVTENSSKADSDVLRSNVTLDAGNNSEPHLDLTTHGYLDEKSETNPQLYLSDNIISTTQQISYEVPRESLSIENNSRNGSSSKYEDFSSTTLPKRSNERRLLHSSKRRGVWKKINVRPIEKFETAESQNIGQYVVNQIVIESTKLHDIKAEKNIHSNRTNSDLFLQELPTTLANTEMYDDNISILHETTIKPLINEVLTTTDIYDIAREYTTLDKKENPKITTTDSDIEGDKIFTTEVAYFSDTVDEGSTDDFIDLDALSKELKHILEGKLITSNPINDNKQTKKKYIELRRSNLSETINSTEINTTFNDSIYSNTNENSESTSFENFEKEPLPEYFISEERQIEKPDEDGVNEISAFSTDVDSEIVPTESSAWQFHKNLMNSVIYATSTSTEVSHETEICYRGKCIKTNKKS